MSEAHAKPTTAAAPGAAAIQPRAEFRVFDEQIIDLVQSRMWDAGAALQSARRMPLETYFVSRYTGDANVKVRGELLDIKLKIAETPQGYEVFKPAGKFSFPLAETQVTSMFEHLHVASPGVRDKTDFETLMALVRAHPDLAPVTVQKMRYGFLVEGVICEYASVWFNGARIDTACCESENHSSLKKVIELLGIAALPNTSYIRAAQRIVGML